MSRMLYAILNPVVRSILRSPIHGLLSRNTVILEYKGRKSGNTYSTPVSYHAVNGRVHCFTRQEHKWWRNFVDAEDVGLTLRGRSVLGKPTVTADGSPTMQSAFSDFLTAVPRDAPHAGVALDVNGRPVAEDIENAAKTLVFISIEIRNEPASESDRV